MKENCKIVEKARELAGQKGLDPAEVTCEFEPSCDGTMCIKTSNVIFDSQVPRFMNKLEKVVELKAGH